MAQGEGAPIKRQKLEGFELIQARRPEHSQLKLQKPVLRQPGTAWQSTFRKHWPLRSRTARSRQMEPSCSFRDQEIRNSSPKRAHKLHEVSYRTFTFLMSLSSRALSSMLRLLVSAFGMQEPRTRRLCHNRRPGKHGELLQACHVKDLPEAPTPETCVFCAASVAATRQAPGITVYH